MNFILFFPNHGLNEVFSLYTTLQFYGFPTNQDQYDVSVYVVTGFAGGTPLRLAVCLLDPAPIIFGKYSAFLCRFIFPQRSLFCSRREVSHFLRLSPHFKREKKISSEVTVNDKSAKRKPGKILLLVHIPRPTTLCTSIHFEVSQFVLAMTNFQAFGSKVK